MSDGIEERLRNAARDNPNQPVVVYPGDIVFILDAHKLCQPGWVSVNDRLPTVDESHGKIVVHRGEIDAGYFYPYDTPGFYGRVEPKSFYAYDQNDYEVQVYGVTHWMLPEHPLEVPDDIQTIVKNLDDMSDWLNRKAEE